MTIFPFTAGQSLVWDATCSDSFSCSNLIKSASDPGSVARQAEECKVTKYRTLSDRSHFVPLAVETSGIIGPRGTSLLHRIGGLLADQRGDQRESMWLFQRIALAIVRGNAFSIITAAGHRTAFDPWFSFISSVLSILSPFTCPFVYIYIFFLFWFCHKFLFARVIVLDCFFIYLIKKKAQQKKKVCK